MFMQRIVDTAGSPSSPLISTEDVQEGAQQLRANLASDKDPGTLAAMNDPRVVDARRFEWFQRIPIPGTKVFTTTDHSRFDIHNPGWLNTLGDALTPEEGRLLRPMPKWVYIKPLLPDLTGKTVLEIGCNNGFFCFEFAKLGASRVTGYEVHEMFAPAAQWIKSHGNYRNVDILHRDALLDLTLERHDVVFMSEVHAHFVDPLFGISRAVNLAKEWLIIDGAAHPGDHLDLQIGADVNDETGNILYHAWIMSDGLMLNYLALCGVAPERVHRYVAPWHSHIMYVIDTTDVARYRAAHEIQPCNSSFIDMRFRTAT